ncbi:glycoside hydrolase family 2 TIM barrel-domain containing protein [Fibrella sp. ES10-3-2-2]|nr:hypothetical protein A6C57_02040 [Fibrella sp. ES10-3-2-2]
MQLVAIVTHILRLPQRYTALLLSLLALLASCTESTTSHQAGTLPDSVTGIVQKGDTFTLTHQGQPYFIRGVCGQSRLARLHECGGNSIRIWDDSDADFILDQAQQNQLTVFLGLWIEREADGFDYYDEAKITRQFERIRKAVLKYRSHPALLMWCVGNEWTLDATNIRVFDEVNRIAAMIHELDPNHPVTTAVMQTTARPIWLIRDRCPAIDILSLNVYAALHETGQLLQEGGWTKPYIISEYGPKGHWESDLTPWRTSIEPTSQEKYRFVRQNYEAYIASPPPNCLGAYLFLWGNKEEGTHTWYGCFDEQGHETPLVGLLQELWTKQLPVNKAPTIDGLLVDGRKTTGVSFPGTNSIHQARILVHDVDGDSLTYAWDIRTDLSNVYDLDKRSPPIRISGLIVGEHSADIRFTVPRRAGNYRLFANVYDTHNHVGTANLSFRVPGREVP